MIGNFLAVHWLRLCASTAGGAGSILARETKIPRMWHGLPKQTQKQQQNKKTKNNCMITSEFRVSGNKVTEKY